MKLVVALQLQEDIFKVYDVVELYSQENSKNQPESSRRNITTAEKHIKQYEK